MADAQGNVNVALAEGFPFKEEIQKDSSIHS